LNGKKVLITGARKGTAGPHAFAEQGCPLFLIARSKDKLTWPMSCRKRTAWK
jgi:short-subunit dehydrogenase